MYSYQVDTLKNLADEVVLILSDSLKTAASRITNDSVRAMAMKLIDDIQKKTYDARDYLDKVKVEEASDSSLDTIFDYEYFRYTLFFYIPNSYLQMEFVIFSIINHSDFFVEPSCGILPHVCS